MSAVLMSRRAKFTGLVGLFLPVVWGASGCDATPYDPLIPEETSSSSSSSSGDLGPCGMDCSMIETPPCLTAVCNTGQEVGPINTCLVVPAPQGTSCDDGKFCTIVDTCDGAGKCEGGAPNLCGLKPDPCASVLCYEELQKCESTPSNDGDPCTPKDLCQINGHCSVGECIGEPKDCSFSPLAECNVVRCEAATGKCVGTPDPTKDNDTCVLTGDICRVGKTCLAGNCVGGREKDCSALDQGCDLGACNAETGLCGTTPAPIGTPCTPGTAECEVGACNDKGACIASPAPDGTSCNDHNSCTQATRCTGGACAGGSAVMNCSPYKYDGFETCPGGWTFGGDWECGTPMNVGPPAAYIGDGAIATQIDGLYNVNQSYTVAVADSPVINLTTATAPKLSFWAWDRTEGGVFDGWNLKVSTDNGMTFAQVMTVTPPYNLTIAGQPAWGGDHSSEGWRNFTADLGAYVGKSVILRYAFRSDGATRFPGVYVDEFIVAEPALIPLYITTSSALEDIYSGMDYQQPLAKLGGTADSAWSIKPGGKNADWLTIDPMTGVISGRPTPANVGQVSFTVHVEEPSLPSNYAEKTFAFLVKPNSYYTSFEGATCDNGWTFTGDWECGVPSMVGPMAAYIGTKCLATQIDANYTSLQPWGTAMATSPDIDLTNAMNPVLTFRMWLHTEANATTAYDGVNLKVSADGGMTYDAVTAVLPTYPATLVDMQPAWSGNHAAEGWQFYQVDLSPYIGKVIRLQFGFRSDSSGVYPGAYIDDIFIN